MEVLRYAAFTADPAGGNPAGVVLDARGVDDARMLAAAAEVGYSETAFLLPTDVPGEFGIRYFSPVAEVPFCGHATIATSVAHAERHGAGTMRLLTATGPVDVVSDTSGEVPAATLTSVPPRTEALAAGDLDSLLELLRLRPEDLDPHLPPGLAFAGAWHPVLAVASAEVLSALSYEFDGLAALMRARGWPATVAVVHREGPSEFSVRNPFPPGGVVEDPATGSAAAALGGYLRALGLVDVPARLVLRQGVDLGRPGRLEVTVPAGDGGVSVRGQAVRLPG